jgi:hypothetical protein
MRWRGPGAIANDRLIFSSEIYVSTMIAGVQLRKKNSGRESEGALRQDELIDGKPPVVK